MAETNNELLLDIAARVKALQDKAGGDKPPAIPLIDPTANVTSLVLAVEKRLDAARESDNAHNAEIRRIKEQCDVETGSLREKLAEAQLQRIDALALAEKTRIDAKISQGEQSVALTAERTTAQAAALATAVSASAEALRLSAAQQNDVTTKAIRILEQNQYSGAGRQEEKTAGGLQVQWFIALIIGAVVTVCVHFWK